MTNDWMVPEIRGQCSACYRWRDLRFAVICPYCGSTSVMAATTASIEDLEVRMYNKLRDRMRAMDGQGLPLSAGEKASVAECDKIWGLKDDRD